MGNKANKINWLYHINTLTEPPASRGRLRHPDDPGAAGARRCEHDHDLHPRPQPGWALRPKPDGRAEVTTPLTAHHPPSILAPPQPIATAPRYHFPATLRYKAPSRHLRPILKPYRLPFITDLNLLKAGLSQST